jgi:hypothetical protein
LQPGLIRLGSRDAQPADAVRNREREHEQEREQLGSLGDERDCLDRFGRPGEVRHRHRHEQRPGDDLPEAEQPGKQRDPAVVRARNERVGCVNPSVMLLGRIRE